MVNFSGDEVKAARSHMAEIDHTCKQIFYCLFVCSYTLLFLVTVLSIYLFRVLCTVHSLSLCLLSHSVDHCCLN